MNRYLQINLYIYLGILTIIQVPLQSQKIYDIKLYEYLYLGILTII